MLDFSWLMAHGSWPGLEPGGVRARPGHGHGQVATWSPHREPPGPAPPGAGPGRGLASAISREP